MRHELTHLVEIGKGIFKKYPYTEYGNELRIDDEVAALFGYVSETRDLANKVVDNNNFFGGLLDKFLEEYDLKLSNTVEKTLKEWQKTGYLNIIVNEALQTQMDEVSKEVSLKADSTRVENVAQQINELVLSAGSEEPTVAEIIQARPDSFGNTFDLLKNHLDNTEQLLKNGVLFVSSKWEQGSILEDGSNENQNSGYIRMTKPMPKPSNKVIFIDKPANYTFSIAYYNQNMVFVERSDWLSLSQSVLVDHPYYAISFGVVSGALTPSDHVNTKIYSFYKENYNSKTISEKLLNATKNKVDITMTDFVHGGLTQDGGTNTSAAFLHNVEMVSLTIGSVLNIVCSSGYTARIHFYNENKVFVGNTVFKGGSFNETITHPYFRVLVTHPTIRPISLNNVKLYVVVSSSNNENDFNGETVLDLGDSIAAGANNNYKGYSHLICEKNGLPLYSHSKGGATFADNQPDRSFIKQQILDFISQNPNVIPDYIIMNGLTNDILYSEEGEITSDYNNVFNENTFCGGFESALSVIRNNFPNAKFIFVKVHNMSTREAVKQKRYQELASTIVRKWSGAVVDLYNEGNLNTQIEVMRDRFTDGGTHPNLLCYNLFYVPQIESKMKSL